MRPNWFDKPPKRREPSLFDELRASLASIKLEVISPEHLRLQLNKSAWCVKVLVLVWLAAFLVLAVLMGSKFPFASQRFGFIPSKFFAGKEVWRIFTAMFLHGGVAHLAVNSAVFLLMAPLLEKDQGVIILLVVFFLGALGGFLLHGLFYIHETVPTIGASGGISAVLGTYPVLYKRALIVLRVEPTGAMLPAVPLVWFWLIMQLLWSVLDAEGTTSYLSHIGGFVVGFIIALILRRLHTKKERKAPLRVIH